MQRMSVTQTLCELNLKYAFITVFEKKKGECEFISKKINNKSISLLGMHLKGLIVKQYRKNR